jgi:hypothetical protein
MRNGQRSTSRLRSGAAPSLAQTCAVGDLEIGSSMNRNPKKLAIDAVLQHPLRETTLRRREGSITLARLLVSLRQHRLPIRFRLGSTGRHTILAV